MPSPLLLAPQWADTRRAYRSRSIQIGKVHSTVGSCRCSHPVQSRDGRACTADIRSIASGQGSCGTRRGNVPGQARNRTTACGRNHHRRCEPRAGGLPSTLQRPLQGACAGVGSRLSCRKRGDVPGEDPVLQVQAQSRQGQHGQIPLAHNCCPVRTGRPTPEQLWMCLKLDNSTHDAAWKRRRVRVSFGASPGEPHTHPLSINPPTVWVLWAAKLATRQGRASHRHLRSQQHGTSSQNSETAAAQEAHAAADGQMEGGAEGEAQRSVHSWDAREAYTQRHREEVHERREPTHGAHSADLRTHLIIPSRNHLCWSLN